VVKSWQPLGRVCNVTVRWNLILLKLMDLIGFDQWRHNMLIFSNVDDICDLRLLIQTGR
jgi:hypothetical protein